MNVLVLGGSRGIGRETVRLLRSAGHDVTFTYRKDIVSATSLEEECGAAKLAYDQNSDNSIATMVQVVQAGTFDGLVNSAAEKFTRRSVLQMDSEEYLSYIIRGIRGAYRISQAFAQCVKDRKGEGAIVHVLSSVLLGIPPEKQAAYVGLKHLLWGLAKSQAVDLKNHRIRVNCVSPGMTRTEFNSDLPPRFIEMYEETLPMKRIARPEEVASAIRYLLDPSSRFVNGINLPVTGGAI